jgi:hypothetical protein
LRGSGYPQLLTKPDDPIKTRLFTEFVIAVSIPDDLFGFTGELEIALCILDGNKVIQACELKKEMGGRSVTDVMAAIIGSFSGQHGLKGFG